MGLLTPELATKRLQSAQSTQDGIEAISTWMLHHTDSVRMMAECWLNLYRTEGEDRRVVLFYIMNDVVQRAKKKHVDVVCSTFEQPVLTAVCLGRFSEKLRSVMSRCLKLIAECKAFSSAGLDKMNRMISDPNGDTDDGNYEIDVIDLAKKIEAFMQSVVSINKGYEILKRAPQDFEEQIQTRMKDRKEGAVLLKETRTSILRLEKFGEAVANNNKRLYEFVDAIETAKRLFNMQLRDVAVVEDAYVKFGQGVREVQEELEEMVRSGVYPAGSPPRDAPSPSAEDDVFSDGVEQVLNKIRPHDVTDEADMEVDDDEPPLSAHQWEKKTPVAVSSSRPSLVERAAALAAHMGIDPRARSNPVPSSIPPSPIAPSPAKKPSIDSAALHQIYVRAAATLPTLPTLPSLPSVQQTQPVYGGGVAASVSSAAPPSSFSLPPPLFPSNIPPPPPSVVAQFMALHQQQQGAATPAPQAVHTQPPLSMPPSAPPPISPYSAPPPGYPTATAAAPAAQQYMAMQQQQQQPTVQHQNQQQLSHSHFSPPPTRGYSFSGTTGGYEQPVAAAAACSQYGGGNATSQQYGGTQQGYGMEQQTHKKYSTMPEYGRSNSVSGIPLHSPTPGTQSGYFPMQNNPSTPGASTSSGVGAVGTPYTPTAPGLRGRKGSEGGGGGG
ncbi:hypothetical protein PENTCL1PPCAC_22333, partial [Pristionchus entomophagus]